jgi:hypothetical protein
MKKMSIYFLALAILFLAVPTVHADSPSLSGLQIFPIDNIWNAKINSMQVDPHSSTWIKGMGTSSALRASFGNGAGAGYNLVDNKQSTYTVQFEHPELSDRVPYPIPKDPQMENSGTNASITTCVDTGEDCHLAIINTDTNILYELLAVKLWPNGTYTAFTGGVYNLSSNVLRTEGTYAGDASSLPMTAGLIRYDEIQTGSINHALLISPFITNASHVWPARADSSDYVDGAYPAMGQRFRLKASYDISGFSPTNQIILTALKQYGGMVGTNAGSYYINLWGTYDSRWDEADLAQLGTVHASDFEAVDVSSLMLNKDSGQVQISNSKPTLIPTPTPTPTPTLTPTPSPTSAAIITVTSPNGGEIWKRSTSQTIGWSYTGSPGSKVNIILLKRGTNVGTIASNVPIGSGGKGSYSWKIPSNRQTGTDYKITVQSTSQSAVKDTSNNYFTIRY